MNTALAGFTSGDSTVLMDDLSTNAFYLGIDKASDSDMWNGFIYSFDIY